MDTKPTNHVERARLNMILNKIDGCRKHGDFGEALRVLKEEPRFRYPHSEISERVNAAQLSAERARLYFHMGRHEEAFNELRSVQLEYRAYNPSLDAICHNVSGLILKRMGRQSWKDSDFVGAQQLLTRSEHHFSSAVSASIAARDRVSQHNNELNLVYLKGLRAEMLGEPFESRKSLLWAAVITEDQLRSVCIDQERNDVAGALIIADLAYGAKMSLDQARQMSLDGDDYYRQVMYQEAATRVFGKANSWQELLLEMAKGCLYALPEGRCRALILAAKFMNSMSNAWILENQALIWRLLITLEAIKLDVGSSVQGHVVVNLRRAIADLSGLSKRTFPGRRIFR